MWSNHCLSVSSLDSLGKSSRSSKTRYHSCTHRSETLFDLYDYEWEIAISFEGLQDCVIWDGLVFTLRIHQIIPVFYEHASQTEFLQEKTEPKSNFIRNIIFVYKNAQEVIRKTFPVSDDLNSEASVNQSLDAIRSSYNERSFGS